VLSGNGTDANRLEHQSAGSRVGFAGWFSYLSFDGNRYCNKLVHPAFIFSQTWNDSLYDWSGWLSVHHFRGYIAMGDVACDRADGGLWSDVARLEVEVDRQDFPWSARKSDGTE